jgi:hypothetical protein
VQSFTAAHWNVAVCLRLMLVAAEAATRQAHQQLARRQHAALQSSRAHDKSGFSVAAHWCYVANLST